ELLVPAADRVRRDPVLACRTEHSHGPIIAQIGANPGMIGGKTGGGCMVCGIATAVVAAFCACAHADDVKIGVIAPFTGPAAGFGQQIEAGMRAYMKVNGDAFAGRKVQLIVRDTGGPNPEVAKLLAQEL